jgi:hypothetical protein
MFDSISWFNGSDVAYIRSPVEQDRVITVLDALVAAGSVVKTDSEFPCWHVKSSMRNICETKQNSIEVDRTFIKFVVNGGTCDPTPGIMKRFGNWIDGISSGSLKPVFILVKWAWIFSLLVLFGMVAVGIVTCMLSVPLMFASGLGYVETITMIVDKAAPLYDFSMSMIFIGSVAYCLVNVFDDFQ